MSDLHGLQAILGTDKKNPMFAVYRDPKKQELHVYYGFELLEVVPDDKTSPRFRLMVAQLYNAGVKGLTLIDVFEVDPKSMRKWGRALKSGDPEALVTALQAVGPRKLTLEIRAYIKRRFPILYTENSRNYISRLRQEISNIFDVQISGEGLRPLLNELKEQFHNNTPNTNAATESSNTTTTSQPSLTPPETDDPPAPSPSEKPDDPPEPSANQKTASHNPNHPDKAEQPSAKKGDLAV